ncbi:MAG: hypothetical protein AB7I01_03680 [Gammaproteobacteria bacterium]
MSEEVTRWKEVYQACTAGCAGVSFVWCGAARRGALVARRASASLMLARGGTVSGIDRAPAAARSSVKSKNTDLFLRLLEAVEAAYPASVRHLDVVLDKYGATAVESRAPGCTTIHASPCASCPSTMPRSKS